MNYVLSEKSKEIAKLAAEVAGLPNVEVQASPKFGADFAIPCFKFAAELKKSPNEIAQDLTAKLTAGFIAKTEAASGFVNIWLKDEVIKEAIVQTTELGDKFGSHDKLKGQEVLVEHTDPNPFKEVHIGHAYSNTIGEAVARLYKLGGAKVSQVSYHGDVGMHVAMAVWAISKILSEGEGEWFEGGDLAGLTMDDVAVNKRVAFLGAAYARGATAYKEDEQAANEIKQVNVHIYAHDDEGVSEVYETGKRWSFDYFDDIYEQLGTGFEKRYLESEVGPIGAEIVKNNIGDVFEQSDGAVVYNGEAKADLHTRVFLNSQGLPTYEAKELGLTFTKQNDFPQMTKSVVITANEIDEYFKVLIAAMSELDPNLAAKMRHISHGMVKLTSGKMSSRTGQILRAIDVLDQVKQVILAGYKTEAIDDVKLAAVKYAFLKQRISGDIAFDINESVSLEGNSGPYIQYAHARGQSILAKSKAGEKLDDLDEAERALAVKILAFTDATSRAIYELAPHNICTYLYELTQTFNRFYESNRVIDDPREATRITLVKAYCQVLKNGLAVLNIPAPNKL